MKIVCNRLLSLTYDIELIKILSENIRLGVMGANFFTPIIVSFILLEQINRTILVIWLISQFLILFFRFLIGKKLNQAVKIKNELNIEKYFRYYLLMVVLSGLSWGFIVVLTIYYSTEIYVLMMITVVFGLTSASVSTLGSIFHAMFLFSISIFIPVVLALFFIKFNYIYFFEGILIISYTLITTKAFYTNYLAMKRNIEKQYELEVLNKTLESRIKKEVEKNREKERYLLQQNRLAQMGELISMIAHQWRQPLSSISSISAALELKTQIGNIDNEFIIENVKKIKNYTTYLSETINDFRDFFKEEKEKQKTTLVKIVKNSLSIIGDELKNNNILVKTDFNSNSEVCVYANELQQVILSIIKNAEDALVENEVENPILKISVYETRDRFFLNIEDNAGGIPEEIKNKIFEPYFSTKLKKDGTGLGLYMSKIIVEKHCLGKLYFSNTENGAIFVIELYKENIESKQDEY